VTKALNGAQNLNYANVIISVKAVSGAVGW
jgi:hypothetical protein